jgi:hypothetical protein
MYGFEVAARSAAGPDEVWAVLVDSLRWPDWTLLPTPTMTAEGDPAPFGLGAIRCFRLGPFTAEEEVIGWEPPRRYRYTVRRMPVRGYRAEVVLEPVPGGTAIAWRAEFERCTVPGLSRTFRWSVKVALGRLARNLARHAEERHHSDPEGTRHV